jgi:capsular polysaccharide export protein
MSMHDFSEPFSQSVPIRRPGSETGSFGSEPERVENACQGKKSGFRLEDLPFYRRILLLQGPVGPFFKRFANFLEQRGARVTKVNFNSGDDFFFRDERVIRFAGTLEESSAFLKELIADGKFEAVFLFGDCRPIHREVRAIAGASDCAVWVFEEGYIRPAFITLERGGVNAFSELARLQLDELRAAPLAQAPEVVEFPNAFRKMAWQAFTYFFIMWLGSWRYPKYVHHKPTGIAEACRWVRSLVRKHLYRFSEAATVGQVLSAGEEEALLSWCACRFTTIRRSIRTATSPQSRVS